MNQLVENEIGLLHLLVSVLALLTGSLVLLLRKGTRLHKGIGYVYAGSMLLVNTTAFMIYRLFGGVGVFHLAALLSLLTLFAGMAPALRKKPEHWRFYHAVWMYWSVIGLYAAFASEAFTRFFSKPFFNMVGIATLLIIGVGAFFFRRFLKKWKARYLQ